MNFQSLSVRQFAACVLLCLTGASQAALTVVTTRGVFNASTSDQGEDAFTANVIIPEVPLPFILGNTTGTNYMYFASADRGLVNGGIHNGPGGFPLNPSLSTVSTTDTITFGPPQYGGLLGPNISAIGGNFYGRAFMGAWALGDITVSAFDSLGGVATQTIFGAAETSFIGFLSDGIITKMTVAMSTTSTPPTGMGTVWAAVDNLVLAKVVPGQIPAVPEPETYALMLAGLGFLGFSARRRRD